MRLRRLPPFTRGALLASMLAVAGVPAIAGPTIPELVEVADVTNLSASPSGRQIVFRVDRASIGRNSYSLDWYVADLETGTVRRLADGGAPIEGAAEPLAVETAVWSPDEQFVYFRALVDGAIGIWRAAVDGSGRHPVVVGDADVEDLAATPDGEGLTYLLGPSRAEVARAERREYEAGILVDSSVDINQNLYRGGWVNGRLASQRLVGQWYIRAGLLWQEPRRRYRLNLQSLRTAAAGPVPLAATETRTPAVAGAPMVVAEEGRPVARLSRRADRTLLELETADGMVACDAAACRGAQIAAVAWRPGTDDLAFTTNDGQYRQTLHLWDTARGTVRTVVRTEGLISGSLDPSRPCAITLRAAVCVTAGAVSPPRLERIDLASGKRTILFDPNPFLRQRETARVEQLNVPLGNGREAAGVLLLPRNLRAPAPLFVSYYYCPGYLRGGAGDEYPLVPLVDAGFVVACLNMVRTENADAVENYRTGLASTGSLIDLLASRDLIDPTRVGMGGFSFSSEVTMWVAMKSDLLAAAAIASPQYSPSAFWSSAMPGRDFEEPMRTFFRLGIPDETPKQWHQYSPAFNVGRIDAPLLMQMPENEARQEVEIFSRLAHTPTPVELFAFPDESHRKFQPRHRQAVYRRNLDWFRYWLQGYSDPDPAKAEQYRRWDAMRVSREEAQRSNERNQASAEAKSSSRM